MEKYEKLTGDQLEVKLEELIKLRGAKEMEYDELVNSVDKVESLIDEIDDPCPKCGSQMETCFDTNGWEFSRGGSVMNEDWDESPEVSDCPKCSYSSESERERDLGIDDLEDDWNDMMN